MRPFPQRLGAVSILVRPRTRSSLDDPPDFRSLQIGRGIAALIVVLFHNSSISGIEKYFPQKYLGLLSFGNAGVQFFFVLSGFIIFLVYAKDIGEQQRFVRFFSRDLSGFIRPTGLPYSLQSQFSLLFRASVPETNGFFRG